MTGIIAIFEKSFQLALLEKDRLALCVSYLLQIKTYFYTFVYT